MLDVTVMLEDAATTEPNPAAEQEAMLTADDVPPPEVDT